MKSILARRLSMLSCLVLAATSPVHNSGAQLMIYNNRATFLTDLAAFGVRTLDFEAESAGATFSDPSTIGGITFSGFGSPDLLIGDTFEAASGVNYLGVNNPGTFDQFSFADALDLGFAPANAIGLSIITSEVPGLTLFDADIQIDVPGIGTALLDADTIDRVTPGGDQILFIGLIDLSNTFDTAQLTGSGAFGFYNIDDITTAVVPEPGTGWIMVVLLPALLAVRYSQRLPMFRRTTD